MEVANSTEPTLLGDVENDLTHQWLEAHAHGFRMAELGMAVLGLVGNTLAIVVLRRKRMWCSTACFLVVLALYDNVLLLIALFRFFAKMIPRSNIAMRSFQYVVFMPMSYIVQTGTIYMTLIVTLERYIAVCWPLKAKFIFSKMSAPKISLLVFVWCLIYNIPHYMAMDLRPRAADSTSSGVTLPPSLTYNESVSVAPSNGTTVFDAKVPSLTPRPIVYPFSTFYGTFTYRVIYKIYIQLLIKYLIPWIAMMVFNILLLKSVHSIRVIRRHRGNRSQRCPSDKGRRLTIPVIAVTTLLFLAYPFPAMEEVYCQLMATLGNPGQTQCSRKLRFLLHLCGEIARVLNSAANFFVYCLLGRRFRMSLCHFMYTIRRRMKTVANGRGNNTFKMSRTGNSIQDVTMTSGYAPEYQ